MDYLPAHQIHRALARLSRQELTERLQAVRALSHTRGLRYLDDGGRPKTIDLALLPWILTPRQVAWFGQLVHTIVGALVRVPVLYAAVPSVRRILPMEPSQEAWLRLTSRHAGRPWAVIGRMDSTATFGHPRWRSTCLMLEPNAVGVGGVHYAPTACSVILDVLGDVLATASSGRTVGPMPDPRVLLREELDAVAHRLGRRLRGVAFIENMDFTTGTDEFGALVAHAREQGLQAVVADPRDLRVRGRRVLARGIEVDLCYRDCELSEFVELEADGHRLAGMRQMIREGRLVSSLLWEFDQKSCWELFTDPTYARHFTPAQRRAFAAHLPWTRLVRDERVSDPSGRRVELPSYIRRHQQRLVLKPNMLYGGQGVTIGHVVTRAVWEATLAKALRGRTRYVVQALAPIATERFPMLERGHPRDVSRAVVSGFFFNSRRVGLVGRFSANPVVNVSRGGGLLSALMVQ